jgi:aryl-phospho-beta-D-glucosidase BglC (GH1 family)
MRSIDRSLALACAVAALLLVVAPAHASPQRFVTTRGKELVGLDGRPLLLKGINLGNWLLPEGYMFDFKSASSPRRIEAVIAELVGEEEARRFWTTFRDRYVTRDDIRLIKRAGFNSVRVPFSYRLFVTDDAPRRFEGPGYELLDRVVGWCRDEGVYVVLDMHGAPGGQTGDNIDDSWGYPFLYDDEESQRLTVELWERLARRYRDEPIVVGYDLLNEPIAHYFDVERLNPKLEPLYRRIVAAIRRVDPNHVVFLGGAQWNSNFRVFGPPFDRNSVYTFHKYWTEPTEEVIREYVDYSEKHDVPLYMGESGENTDEWIATFRQTLERHKIGWAFWPYKKLGKPSCVVTIKTPEGWDRIVAYANLPRATYEEVRKSRPEREVVRAALAGYLENVALARCEVNGGYLRALGLDVP